MVNSVAPLCCHLETSRGDESVMPRSRQVTKRSSTVCGSWKDQRGEIFKRALRSCIAMQVERLCRSCDSMGLVGPKKADSRGRRTASEHGIRLAIVLGKDGRARCPGWQQSGRVSASPSAPVRRDAGTGEGIPRALRSPQCRLDRWCPIEEASICASTPRPIPVRRTSTGCRVPLNYPGRSIWHAGGGGRYVFPRAASTLQIPDPRVEI